MAQKSSQAFDTYVEGLDDVLRALRKLPKEATAELRQASAAIADKHMAPAWRETAIQYAGPWGQGIADSVRVKKDRLPAVKIGLQKKAYENGASSNAVRYLTDKGDRGRAGQQNRAPKAFGQGTDWMSLVAPRYAPQAMQEWGKAVDQLVIKWRYM